jgi:DNA-binding FadR family transcriptional regulator
MSGHGSAPTDKVAERLARRVVDDIAEAGWPVGRVLGTEPELIEHYQVSRNAFRESVRILEHLGAARTREGRKGGLVVTAPQSRAVTQAAAIGLRYAGVEVDELSEARMDLELNLVERAVTRLDRDGEQRLEAVIAAELETPDDVAVHATALHTAIAELSRSRPLALFLDVVISLSDEYAHAEVARGDPAFADQIRASHRAHVAIVAAIVDRDVDTAIRRMRTHLTAVHKWMPRS